MHCTFVNMMTLLLLFGSSYVAAFMPNIYNNDKVMTGKHQKYNPIIKSYPKILIPLFMADDSSDNANNKKSGFDLDSMMNRVKDGFNNNKSNLKTYSLSKPVAGTKTKTATPSTTNEVEANDDNDGGINFSVLTDRVKDFDVNALSKSFGAIKDNAFKGELGTRGEIYVVAQFSILLFVLIGTIPIIGNTFISIIGPFLLLSGIAIIVLGVLDLGSSLSPWSVPVDNNDSTLIKTGMYQYIRHPLYSGLIASCTGLGIITESSTRLLLTILLIYVLNLKSNIEEQELINKYNNDYKNYQKDVTGKFFPNELFNFLPWNNKQD